MPIKRGVYRPDFETDMQMPQMMDMSQPQNVNIQPAVGAFQQRFMNGNKGDMSNVPTTNALPESLDGMDAGGGMAMKKGLGKSL